MYKRETAKEWTEQSVCSSPLGELKEAAGQSVSTCRFHRSNGHVDDSQSRAS
jgi:hypothetical protein